MSPLLAVEPPRTLAPLHDRQALRFLLDHRLGRLVTTDPLTGEPHVTPVHYVPEILAGGGGGAAFLTILPADAPQVAAIRRGGSTILSVPSRKAGLPAALLEGRSSPVIHVQAQVQVELLQTLSDVEHVLRRQIASVLAPLPQEDKSDPVGRARQGELSKLVGLRLSVVDLASRLHPDFARRLR